MRISRYTLQLIQLNTFPFEDVNVHQRYFLQTSLFLQVLLCFCVTIIGLILLNLQLYKWNLLPIYPSNIFQDSEVLLQEAPELPVDNGCCTLRLLLKSLHNNVKHIWTYQQMYKNSYKYTSRIIFLTQQFAGSYVSHYCILNSGLTV